MELVAPIKPRSIKQSSQEQFDGAVAEKYGFVN